MRDHCTPDRGQPAAAMPVMIIIRAVLVVPIMTVIIRIDRTRGSEDWGW
ncbi:hypothetical protein [Microlunatus soli]|nr:hypothetical protein [Microlunatus soli]